ncbi:MAG: hypothetical protein AAB561_01620 [Patescibacteria group bacterium]
MKNKLIIKSLAVGIVAVMAIFLFVRDQYPVPADWKTYTNEKFGIKFRYPPTWQVCDDMSQLISEKVHSLQLIISQQNECMTSQGNTVADGDITVGVDASMAATTGELEDPDLARLFSNSVDVTINPQLKYFKLDGVSAYGGPVIHSRGQEPTGYKVLMNHEGINIGLEYANEGNSYPPHPETETIVHSFRFDPEKFPR